MTDQTQIGEEIGRKLSAKEVGYDKTTILEMVMTNKEVPHFLFRVIGMATGTKPYESEYGDGEALLGQFQAIKPDGTEINGSSLYLPAYIQDMVVAGLNAAGDGAAARIGIDIYAQYDADAATFYVFSGRSLLAADTQAVDSIKALIGKTPMPTALPAPAKK